MADKIVGREVNPNPNSGIPIRMKDMGDGTFAEVISSSGGGGGGGGGAVTVADGADVTQGLIADAAVAAGASGTIGAKLRAISRDIGALLAQIPATLGLKASAASMSVVLASDDAQLGAEASGFSGSAGATGLRGRLSEISTAIRGILSMTQPDVFVASTNITAQNLNPTSGVATANSTISVPLSGQNVVAVCITTNSLGATATFQVSYDNATWKTALLYASPDTNPPALASSGTIATTVTGNFLVTVAGAKAFRIAANAATVSGTLTATLNASVAASPIILPFNLASVGNQGTAAALAQVGGSSSAALGTCLVSPASNPDYAAVNWAAASGSGGTITDVGGAVVSYDLNLSAFTAGSSSGLDVFMESSRDGGTTWDTHWQFEALTATGHAAMPALMVSGARRRLRWVNRGGAATTATVTATANRMSVAPAKVMRQFFDRTAGLITNPTLGATTTGWINGTATAGAGYETGGASTISAEISVGTAATPGAYQLQVCSFNSTSSADWVSVGSPVTAVATSTVRTSYTGVTERFFRVICSTAGASQTGNYIALTAS